MIPISVLFAVKCSEPSDINEHLPLLYALSFSCEGVAEFGIRAGVSTVALVAGQNARKQLGLPAKYVGYDINSACAMVIGNLVKHCHPDFVPGCTIADTTKELPYLQRCDMLFIDTKHDGPVVEREIITHANKVNKYIVFHDTTTFGLNGETPGETGLLSGIHLGFTDPAVRGEWDLIHQATNNNGLSVYQRKSW